jgi:hypothetical protein
MNTQNYTLENFKSRAKKLKNELNITHIAALELLAKQSGFSNWIHCQRFLSKQTNIVIPPVELIFELSFTDWLERHKNRDSPLGDLSKEMLANSTWPSYKSLEEYLEYFLTQNFRRGASQALEAAWKSYKRYIKARSGQKIGATIVNKIPSKHGMIPKISYHKNITPLHISKRDVEKFNVGSSAWISWDSRKAIPVEIVEIDEKGYSVRILRPIKKAGNIHSLFLDEVRSTPMLACINRVTL